MEHSKDLRGLIVDLVTPLRPNGEIDGPGLGRHLDRVLPHVHAVFIASPYAGEGIRLSATQREDLLDKSLVVIRGQLPLLVWVTQKTEEGTKETLLRLRKRIATRKYGGSVFWVDTPLYYHSNRGLHVHYQNLCTLAKEAWILHNDPDLIVRLSRSFKRNNIRTAILKSLTAIEGIKGLVFLGPLSRARNYEKAVRKRSGFRIYDGDESNFLIHPSMSGIVSAGANLAPRAWRKVTDASLASADHRQYPDRLQQLWNTGLYLQQLLGIYRPYPLPVMAAALSNMGVMEYAGPTGTDPIVRSQVKEIEAIMKAHGDWEG